MEFQTLVTTVTDFINKTLFQIGETPVSLSSIFVFILLLIITIKVSRLFSRKMLKRALNRINIGEDSKFVLIRFTEYLMISIGAIIAFQTVGINLSGLAVIFGLLSVGIGFGLQNITSNFISGLVLLAERPISINDRVTVGETEGDVEAINMRSTTIRSLDNIFIIVPNSEFIASRVTNWSHGDPKIRVNLNVGVSYQSDLETVLRCLREVAEENLIVLKAPEPEVLLMSFGDSSWDMRLRCWIPSPKHYYTVRSELNCAIVTKFRENSVEIPFPQRDLHVRSPLPVPFMPNAKNMS